MSETRSSRASTKSRLCGWALGLTLSTGAVGASIAQAQTPAPAAPAAVPMAAAPEAPPPGAPPVIAPPPVIVVPVAPPVEKPVTSAEAMPAARPEVLPPIDVGAWTRVGGVFQKASDPSSLGDFHMDSAYVELHAGGKIHKNVGVTVNLNANMVDFGSATAVGSVVKVMDAIISFDLVPELHLWAGHLLVPVDRANASGPFFMIPWNYPGFGGSPKEGPSGRNNGAVVWGDIEGGKLTYLAGVFDDADVTKSPLFSGRLRLALLDAEPGFWGNGSYFGDKDLLSIGVGAQYQKHGSSSALDDKDWGEFNADVLFEKKMPGGGWATVEGAYYHYNVLSGAVSDTFYALGAFALPPVGEGAFKGNIQPMVRFQGTNVKDGAGSNPWNLDGAVSYLIKGPALRLNVTYSHTKITDDITTNSVQLGAQAIFF